MGPVTKRISHTALVVIVLWVLLIATIKLISPEPDYSQTLPQECEEDSLNCAGFGKWSHRMDNPSAVEFEGSMADARDSIEEWISERERSTTVHSDNDTFHVVETSLLLRFEDDLVIHIECSDGLTIIHAHSSSRIGVGDLGVNPERLDSLKSHLIAHSNTNSRC